MSCTYVLRLKFGRVSPLPRKPSLSQHLRNARVERGLSVAEVAEQVGVSSSSIYFWETDHCRPRDENLSALCKVLKLPVRATRAMAAG
jgi:DNA-binding XRE family transcriptional regulator